MEYKLSEKEQQLYNLIVSKVEITIKMIQESLSPKHVGAIGKLIRYGKIELSSNYKRRDEKNRVIKCYIVKKENK